MSGKLWFSLTSTVAIYATRIHLVVSDRNLTQSDLSKKKFLESWNQIVQRLNVNESNTSSASGISFPSSLRSDWIINPKSSYLHSPVQKGKKCFSFTMIPINLPIHESIIKPLGMIVSKAWKILISRFGWGNTTRITRTKSGKEGSS